MTVVCYPQQVRSLATWKPVHHKTRTTWMLDICGPYCPVCAPPVDTMCPSAVNLRSTAFSVMNTVSDALRLPVLASVNHRENSITVSVIVSDEAMGELRDQVYREMVKQEGRR